MCQNTIVRQILYIQLIYHQVHKQCSKYSPLWVRHANNQSLTTILPLSSSYWIQHPVINIYINVHPCIKTKWIHVYYRDGVRMILVNYPQHVNTGDNCQFSAVGYDDGDSISESQWKGECGRIFINDSVLINGTKGQYGTSWCKPPLSFQIQHGINVLKDICFLFKMLPAPAVCYNRFVMK